MTYVDINMDIYRTLVTKGLSEADAERWATRAVILRLPALFHALVSAGCPPEQALAAVEEVADYADRQRAPLRAIGQWWPRLTPADGRNLTRRLDHQRDLWRSELGRVEGTLNVRLNALERERRSLTGKEPSL